MAHDRMAERERARRGRGPHQPARQQRVQRRQRRVVGQLGDRRREVELERVAAHRSRIEQRAGARRERGELGRERRGDRGRQRPVRRHPTGSNTAVAMRGELLQVERVAARIAVDRTGVGADELGRLGPG